MFRTLSTFLIASVLSVTVIGTPVRASEKHDHDHKATSFTSVAAGVTTLDGIISEIRTRIGKGDFAGLHPASEEIDATAEGLEARTGDVTAENQERFKFNTGQLKALATQLEEAHESKNKEEAEKVVKRMEGVRDRLKAVAP